MSYSFWVADDPDLETTLAEAEVEEPSGFPHFLTSHAGMRGLRTEMETQGMFAFMPRCKFEFNDGEHVTSDEIAAALRIACSETLTMPDEEWRQFWRSWLEFLRISLDHDGIRVY